MSNTAPPARRFRLAALGTAVLAWGCALPGRAPLDQGVSAAGASLRTTITTEYVESRTVSFALDRIDQRSLPLDRTYKRYGSGRGVTVYVFDGGILGSHPELEGRVRRGYDAFPDERQPCNAHGTAVAGAVAGATLGVAPEAEIVDIKMVECRRMRGSIEAIVRGARWVLEDHARNPGRRAVANWSFIADTSHAIPALDSAVRELRAAGIPVIVSAGNLEMDACRIAPGNAPGAILVGASRIRRIGTGASAALTDARVAGTAFGPCIDVYAPGDSVLLPSLDAARQPIEQLWTGTSMAAGYVSGAAALYLEANPLATADDVSRAVTRGGAPVDPRTGRAGLLHVAPGSLADARPWGRGQPPVTGSVARTAPGSP